MQKQELWGILSELCEREGVSLFDAELSGGTLRVYIQRGRSEGVQHSHCAGVSHRILNHDRVEEMLPGNTLLEVSSPGINRKLSRPEHYESAIGERVRVSYRNDEGKKNTVTGDLLRYDGATLFMHCEDGKRSCDVTIPVSAVHEARVDFLFE